jgi:hypothetical protein
MGELRDFLHEQATNQLLKYAAGKQMFCPMCNKVLDWKTTAILEVSHEVHGKKSQVGCVKCVDTPAVKERMKKFTDLGFTFEIIKYTP